MPIPGVEEERDDSTSAALLSDKGMNGSYGMILIMVVARCEWFVWYDPNHFFFFCHGDFFWYRDCYSILLEKHPRKPILCALLGRAEGRTGNPIPNVSTTRGTKTKPRSTGSNSAG
jgi:hypothetical protein